MNHVYTELPSIPIPDGCHVNRKSKQVSRDYYVNGKRHKHVIGYATTDGMMFANDIFRTYYPVEWEDAFGDRAPGASTVMAGLYMTFLAIGWRTGLYPALQASLGSSCANVLMDLAMSLIRHKSETGGTIHHFSEMMAHQVLFSRKPLSTSFISEFRGHNVNHNVNPSINLDALDRFRDDWLAKRTENGRLGVWLFLDGSQTDSQLVESGPAAHGHSQSTSSTPIINVIWAVDASDGTPVTWFVNPENAPDCTALDEMLRHLANSSLDVKGVILEPALATRDVLALIRAKGLDYIAMLKKDMPGFASMMERHGEVLRQLFANGIERIGTIVGKVDRANVFRKSDVESHEEAHVALYYSPVAYNRRLAELFEKSMDAVDAAERDIAQGKEVSLPEEVREFVRPRFDESGKVVG